MGKICHKRSLSLRIKEYDNKIASQTLGPFKKCVTWIMAFLPHSPLLSPFNFTLSLPLGYSLNIRHYGMRRNFFLHIWLFQHITLYQRRLNITSLVTINFLETHACINNPHKKVVYYNIFVQILYSYFRYTNRLFLGCVLFLARCNISRASWETKKERLSYRIKYIAEFVWWTLLFWLHALLSMSFFVAFFVYSLPFPIDVLVEWPL